MNKINYPTFQSHNVIIILLYRAVRNSAIEKSNDYYRVNTHFSTRCVVIARSMEIKTSTYNIFIYHIL